MDENGSNINNAEEGSGSFTSITSVANNFGEPLYRATGWMKFAGILLIIHGVFLIATIGGILICWLPIWLGILLFSGANEIKVAYETFDDRKFKFALVKLAKFFKIFGIFTLVFLILAVAGIIAVIVAPQLVKFKDMGAGLY